MDIESLGLRACNRSLSALHAEMECLLLGSFMHERQEDNLNMFRDGLFGPIGHDYESDGLAIIRIET
ncbi:hypothetical protein F2Q69_00017017 [Brassica cretica]|uniref:Uncharacterized protein n=1 Tax=Brassica cretica TaxID=69181 RepID=A0A8S9QYJ0_BRACR|nr:hypothetical protein F2Q69_00017017 [Brassica cretica]